MVAEHQLEVIQPEESGLVWTPERRLMQSKIMSRHLKERPWTAEQNAARSLALRNRTPSLEHRAAMHASRKCGTERTPVWQKTYDLRLRELRQENRWRRFIQFCEAKNLAPDDVYFALSHTFDIHKKASKST